MSELTREELLALLAERDRQNEALKRQLNAQVEGAGAIAQENSVAAGGGAVARKRATVASVLSMSASLAPKSSRRWGGRSGAGR